MDRSQGQQCSILLRQWNCGSRHQRASFVVVSKRNPGLVFCRCDRVPQKEKTSRYEEHYSVAERSYMEKPSLAGRKQTVPFPPHFGQPGAPQDRGQAPGQAPTKPRPSPALSRPSPHEASISDIAKIGRNKRVHPAKCFNYKIKRVE